MSHQLPYYKMYPADAEADERFRLMTMAERGLYWTLLNHSWMNDGLPFETDKLCRLCGMETSAFQALWKTVGECFYLDGVRLRNVRQEEEREKAICKSLSASKSGASGQADEPGFLYLIQRADGLVKVGTSVSPNKRLSQLSYKYRESLTLLHSLKVSKMRTTEQLIHAKYAHLRALGEWFRLTQIEIQEITLSITPGGDSGGDSTDHPRLRAYESDSVSESSEVKSETKTETSTREKLPVGYAFDEQYAEFRQTCADFGMAVIDSDFTRGAWFEWLKLDFEQRKAAIAGIEERRENGTDPQMVPRPEKYLKNREWKRMVRKAESAIERSIRLA